ncbi:MBOAT, membrane-bound O-acyltransferase family-domain-containing protein [Suillus clintonianus]|uniref:MBOAT, membrane-bound O-acyltransferase family-domain-containing protein n=1 Tax=Suillus clintonianus TaxID=1904413 RepID=UPI001B876013|nr:MBOAT, membrane-bound O-acyltransferase family-domain-containing protein [Suillus clintonianus]KAG2114825.1 MBOAT, membrane-bound O-acyltransferase family-domain-containing protein [Suillus clintonianus]
MLKDVVIDMPTDMRNQEGNFSRFDLDYNPPKPGGITSLTVDIAASSRIPNEPRPPQRWKTPEFVFYYVVALFAIPFMAWVPIHLSSPLHPNYPYYRHRLSPGWMFGREVDNSDTQYRSFRNNILPLSLLVLLFIALKYIYTRSVLRSASSIPSDKLYLIPFFLAFSALYLIGLHGTSIFKIIFILTTNYWIAKTSRGSRMGPLLTWIFNVLVLFANDIYGGYRYANFHPSLEVLDAFQGIYPRWHINFNITMLRLVSFNMDYYWAHNSRGGESLSSASTEKQRANTPLPLEDYTYWNYIAYVLYPPLYIAGPILTFNNFMWQLHHPTDIPIRAQIRYLVRFLVSLLTMESILHYMYVVAIKDAKAWQGYTPLEMSLIGFWNLIVVWLKLLLPWRFFRLWSLACGIDPPENMVRCVVNNYSTLGFWRSWHRSYNLWVVRYIYIPLGGTKNTALTTALIFSFVALWHDLSFRLLAWGWLVTLFILPELLARYLLPQTQYGQFSWYRHVCAIGGVFNMLMMASANLVGFVIGTEGIMYMASQILGTWQGFRFLLAASCIIFVGIQLMFEYREEEMRKGVYRRC